MSTTLKEEFETLDPAEEVQAAYDNAAVLNWTITRQSVAMSLDAEILSGVFGPEMEGLQEKGVYPNALHDVVVVLWLLSLEPEQVTKARATLKFNKEQIVADAYAWAEAEGIKYGSPKYLNGIRTLTEIVGGIFTSFWAVGGNQKSDPSLKKNIVPPGKSTSRTTQSRPAGKPKATS